MKLFVWDFHGTLEKGNENSVLEISNKVLADFGYRERFNKEDNLALYGVKWFKYFEYLLPNENENVHFELQKACMDFEKKHPEIIVKNIKPNDHAIFVLDAISKKHEQILVSNMANFALERFISAIGINRFFLSDKAFATNSQFKKKTKTKKDLLKEFLRGRDFDSIIIIGDTRADMEMAQVAGGITYLYAHPGRQQVDFPANYKISDLRKVLKEV